MRGKSDLDKFVESKKASLVVDNEVSDDLSRHTNVVNLRASFPLAHRAVFLQSWRYFVAVGLMITLAAGGTVLFTNSSPTEELSHLHHAVVHYTVFGGIFVLCLKLLYEELYHITYYYGYEAEHFVITSGVFLKRRSSLHVSLITDVFLERGLPELVFLVYSLRVANPSSENPFEFIRGLSRDNAIGLQDFLTNLIENTRGRPVLSNETAAANGTAQSYGGQARRL